MHASFMTQAKRPNHLLDAFENEITAELLGLVRHYEGFFSDEHNDNPDIVFKMLEERDPKGYDREASFDKLVKAIELASEGARISKNAQIIETLQSAPRRSTTTDTPIYAELGGQEIKAIKDIKAFGIQDHMTSQISPDPFKYEAAKLLEESAALFSELGLKDSATYTQGAAEHTWPKGTDTAPQQTLEEAAQLAGIQTKYDEQDRRDRLAGFFKIGKNSDTLTNG